MIVGIDLGTTNSLAAVWRDGEARIIPNALGDNLTPSVVGLDDNGEILVGAAARDRLLTHPDRTTAAFKRYMGSNRATRLGDRAFRPEELSALVLRSLKADAEAFLGEPVEEAVITVPAYFNDAQRKATRNAGQIAGFKVERLLNEPTAASLAYGLHQRDAERQFLVFDLGGGTFDVSLLELFDGVMEVRASAGDNFLGGEDFVDVLVAAFMREVGDAAGLIEEPPNPLRHRLAGLLGPRLDDDQAKLRQALREQAERAKRRLTREGQATMTLNHRGQPITWTVTAERFEALSEPLLERLAAPVERALRDARIPAKELDEVVLVGGSTRMPIVRRLVARMFGRLPAGHINPDEVVALGAAVQAGLKARDAALDDVVMTDVAPYTLGTDVAKLVGQRRYESGYYKPIIERNTVIPASRVQTFQTCEDNQTNIVFGVYQGESPRVADNIHLGEVRVQVPPRKAGEEIEERFKALAALKVHPRDQAENRAALARAERLYEELLGEARTFIGEHVVGFRVALDRQDPEDIDAYRAELIRILDAAEGDPYL